MDSVPSATYKLWSKLRERDRITSIYRAIKLLFLSLATFAAAFVIRRTFFWDVMPVSWDQEPPPTSALETAFLLLSIENIAAVVAAIALVFSAASCIYRWRRSHREHIANSK